MSYEKGRNFLTSGELCKAEAAFGEGLAAGDVRCVYGMLKVCLAANNKDGAALFLKQLTDRFSELLALVEAKDEHAVFVLASCCENGWGISQNADRAIKYYSMIADSNILAQYNLGCVLISEEKKDYRAAIPWFEKAMANGDKEARFNLGYCYLQLNDDTSLQKAKDIFMTAAADGDLLAQKTLERFFL